MNRLIMISILYILMLIFGLQIKLKHDNKHLFIIFWCICFVKFIIKEISKYELPLKADLIIGLFCLVIAYYLNLLRIKLCVKGEK